MAARVDATSRQSSASCKLKSAVVSILNTHLQLQTAFGIFFAQPGLIDLGSPDGGLLLLLLGQEMLLCVHLGLHR